MMMSYVFLLNNSPINFARVGDGRRWTPTNQGSCIDPSYLSHTLGPTPHPPFS